MTGIIIAGVIMGLIVLVGAFAMFFLLPLLVALLGAVALMIVMAVVAVLLLPHFVTLDDFKPQIIDLLKQATDREIAIGGPIGFSVWPVLGLQLRDISVGNPAGSKDPIMLSAQEVGVGITLSSMLEHKLELRELRIVGGQFNLIADANGKGNWDMKVDEQVETDMPATGEEGEKRTDLAIKDISIEKIEVIDTSVSYEKPGSTPIDLDDIDLTFTMPSLDKPASFKGDVGLGQRELMVSGEVENPRGISGDAGSGIKLSVSYGSDKVAFTGSVKNATMDGQLEVQSGDLSSLASVASGAKTELPVKTLALSTALVANADKAQLSNMKLNVDDIAINGSLTALLSGARPKVTADVAVSEINLDKFTGGSKAAPVAAQGAGSGSAPAAGAPDLSALDKFNADITAKVAGLTTKGVSIGATTAQVTVQNGRLQFSMTPASLYEGTVAVKADVSAATQGRRSFSASGVLDSMQMEPVLTTFAGFSRLSGKGDASFTVSGPVAAPDAMKRALNGSGKFMFRDGVLKGVNIAGLIRNAKSVLGGGKDSGNNGPPQTEFTELSGTFSIADGVVSNTDLKMLSPLLRVTGQGIVSLPASTVDYKISASLVADLTGQGGTLDRKGLVIPINVRGPFDNLSYQPDLKGLVLGNIDTVKDIGAVVKDLDTKEGQRNARDAVKGLLGLPTKQRDAAPAPEGAAPAPEAAPAEKPAPIKPEDALKQLFGR